MPTLALHVVDLRRRFDSAAPSCILEAVLGEVCTRRIAVVSSFGVDSGVLLHMVAENDPATPVLFVDTGRYFRETLEHRDRLVGALCEVECRQGGEPDRERSALPSARGSCAGATDG